MKAGDEESCHNFNLGYIHNGEDALAPSDNDDDDTEQSGGI